MAVELFFQCPLRLLPYSTPSQRPLHSSLSRPHYGFHKHLKLGLRIRSNDTYTLLLLLLHAIFLRAQHSLAKQSIHSGHVSRASIKQFYCK
jgi:hypothetical protein